MAIVSNDRMHRSAVITVVWQMSWRTCEVNGRAVFGTYVGSSTDQGKQVVGRAGFEPATEGL